MLLSSLEVPVVTNRSETLLFDWEDFEIADGLEKLEETILTRERYEKRKRKEYLQKREEKRVQRILGCSVRQAN